MRFVDVSKGVQGNADWNSWTAGGRLEGNGNPNRNTPHAPGFAWRSGRERTTTGIWMWDTPFIRQRADGELIAVFVMDTQGLYDMQTSQNLTNVIFGVSALLSSHQIYNVDKRVQEDQLQNLAMFSEYASMTACHGRNMSPEQRLPFQKLDFLVRDWQHYSQKETLRQKYESAEAYTKEIFAPRMDQGLDAVREQINKCYEAVNCFMLPSPGESVAECGYDGSIDMISESFLELLTVYFDDLLDPVSLVPKAIFGEEVTARELFTHVEAYTDLLQNTSQLPETFSLIRATAIAQNVNVRNKALSLYHEQMMQFLEPARVRSKEVDNQHDVMSQHALYFYDNAMKLGTAEDIETGRLLLQININEMHEGFVKANKERKRASSGFLATFSGILVRLAIVAAVGDVSALFA